MADKMLGILLPIAAFVACGFEHCVANMFFLPMGILLTSVGIVPAGIDPSVLTWVALCGIGVLRCRVTLWAVHSLLVWRTGLPIIRKQNKKRTPRVPCAAS